MEHEHITFYSNSARGRAALLGGEELITGATSVFTRSLNDTELPLCYQVEFIMTIIMSLKKFLSMSHRVST